MKNPTLALLIIALPFIAKSQNKRWMYVTVTDDNAVMMIDTVSSEIKQDKESTYLKSNGLNLKDYGSNTVSFWVMIYKKTVKNGRTSVTKMIEKVLIDTIKNQYQTSNRVEYANNKVVNSENYTIDWSEIVPGTIAEEFVKFGKAVNNPTLKYEMRLMAIVNQKHYPKLSETE